MGGGTGADPVNRTNPAPDAAVYRLAPVRAAVLGTPPTFLALTK